MSTFAVWDKLYEHLNKKFDAYPPGAKVGECTNDYIVIKDMNTLQIIGLSSEVHYYSVMMYSKTYTGLLKLCDLVKQEMIGIAPLLMPTGQQTPSYYDKEVKAWMTSVTYRSSVRNKLL